MTFDSDPFVRYSAMSTHLIEDKWIAARDARLMYILSGNARFWCNGQVHLLEKGTLLFYPYNQPYRFTDNHGLLFYNLNFDFNMEHTELTTMRPKPLSEHDPSTVLYTAEKVFDGMFTSILCLSNAIWAEQDMHAIYSEGLKKLDGYRDMQSLLTKKLIIHLRRSLQDGEKGALISLIKAKISTCPHIKTKELAAQLGYHPYYLNEVFKKAEGIPIHQYVIRQRTMAAYEQITSTNTPLEEIATRSGFSSQAHLSSTFRRIYGISPGMLRRQS